MNKPEFSAAEIARLHLAYQQAVYLVDLGKETIRLRIGEHNSRLEQLLACYKSHTWALITAYNPYSQCISAAENLLRHQNLLEHLRSLPFTIFDAWGTDETGSWTPEKGLFILGIRLSQAKKIGFKFAQNAIVYGESTKPPELVWLN